MKNGGNFNTSKQQSMSLVCRQSIPPLAFKRTCVVKRVTTDLLIQGDKNHNNLGADDSSTSTRLYLGSSRVLICAISFEAESGIAGSNRDAFELDRT